MILPESYPNLYQIKNNKLMIIIPYIIGKVKSEK